jgi:hypothetical protein
MRRTIGLPLIILLGFSCPVFSSDDPEGAGQEPTFIRPALSAADTENLYLLGKVWGYLKYHHARVTSGCLDWDVELLREVVEIVELRDRDARTKSVDVWSTLSAADMPS